jgi:hypothetical protein
MIEKILSSDTSGFNPVRLSPDALANDTLPTGIRLVFGFGTPGASLATVLSAFKDGQLG